MWRFQKTDPSDSFQIVVCHFVGSGGEVDVLGLCALKLLMSGKKRAVDYNNQNHAKKPYRYSMMNLVYQNFRVL
jgi:hypothetical protein